MISPGTACRAIAQATKGMPRRSPARNVPISCEKRIAGLPNWAQRILAKADAYGFHIKSEAPSSTCNHRTSLNPMFLAGYAETQGVYEGIDAHRFAAAIRLNKRY